MSFVSPSVIKLALDRGSVQDSASRKRTAYNETKSERRVSEWIPYPAPSVKNRLWRPDIPSGTLIRREQQLLGIQRARFRIFAHS